MTALDLASSTSCGPAEPLVLGSTEPRLWTPPLRELSPATSDGFEVIEFARDVLEHPLDPWQEWLAVHALELLPDGRPRFRVVLVEVARQNGKALDVETEVLTANRGWATMADITIGDRVYHPGGHPVGVTFAGGVMTGHDCYRVTTSDGRSVVADADHLWTVEDRLRVKRKGPKGGPFVRAYPVATLTTEQLLSKGLRKSIRSNGRNEWRWHLPQQEPLKTPDVDLPVEPYLFGAWLGDGNSADASLTCHVDDVDHWCEAVTAAGYTPTVNRPDWRAPRIGVTSPGRGRQTRSLGPQLRRLGVLNNKHVPDVYLAAGTAQREALLQGLMDTDGYISGNQGQVEFCSARRNLAEAVLFLARSLGWRATLREGRATLDGRDCGPKYRICWTPKLQDPFAPFRLQRKAARVQPDDGGAGRRTVSISSIEPVESRPVRCIKVDSPDGLFLAGRDLVPTHNTEMLVVLALWWQFVCGVPMVLGTSTKLDYAKESWTKAVRLAEASRELDRLRPGRWKREANGEQESWTYEGARYKIAASNAEGGRSLTVHRLILDELRQHHSYAAWDAAVPAGRAVADFQVWALSNAGDAQSTVLNDLHDGCEKFIESGEGDWRAGMFSWSAAEDADPLDVEAHVAANPNLGRRIDPEAMMLEAKTAVAVGGEKLTGFKTENLCIRVKLLVSAVDAEAWADCLDVGDLSEVRDRVACCLDIAPDGQHATLVAAAMLPDGRVRVEVVAAWDGTDVLRRELRGLLLRVRPRSFGWFPAGPASALAADLRARPGRSAWPPKGVEVDEIRGEAAAVCMGLEEQVRHRRVAHSGDALLDAHVTGSERLVRGDGWVFSRRGEGHCDAAHAVAGAVHLARILPPPKGRPRLVVAT